MVCGLFLHFKQILILAAGGRELWRGETEPARVYCGPNAGQEGQPQIAGVILNLPRVLEFWQLSAKGPGWTSQKTKGRRLFRDVLVPLFLSWKASGMTSTFFSGVDQLQPQELLWKMSSAPQMDSRFYICGYLHEHIF